MLPDSVSICLLLVLSLMPSVLARVIFTRGSEQRFDNGYIDTTDYNFQQDCVKWHNYFRKLHGAPALQYDTTLGNYARMRAIQLAQKDGTNFYHPDDLPYGENLAWNSQEPIDCGLPLKLWYDEWKIYNFKRPNINPANGHFTQMVWKDSLRIGCGQAISKGAGGGTYTVCNYDPPGNYEEEEAENVLPAINGAFYDISSDNKYKNKRIKKIYKSYTTYSNDNHEQYLTANKYYLQKSQANNYNSYSNNYGYSTTQPAVTTYHTPSSSSSSSSWQKKWQNFVPHTNTYKYKSNNYNSYNSYNSYNKYNNNGGYSGYQNSVQKRPTFRMTIGSSRTSW